LYKYSKKAIELIEGSFISLAFAVVRSGGVFLALRSLL
jgi:hypothetical protein